MSTSDEQSAKKYKNLSLDALDHDALKELVNISVGRSADALSRMVGTEVLLSIPDVKLMSNEDAEIELRQYADGDLVMVRQDFSGALSGNSTLLFPEHNSQKLVRLIMQEDLPLEMMTELEPDVLRELGNILINNFLGSLANTLDEQIATGLPHYEQHKQGSERSIFGSEDNNSTIIVMEVDFTLHDRDTTGYLGLLIRVRSIEELMEMTRLFIGHDAS